jgi:hypothetical protein
MSARSIDARLLVRVAAQVEELQLRVTELENGQRINAQTTARHAEALDAIGKALNDDHDEENEEGAMLQ